jgi:flagellar assembly protein FliH
MTKFLRPDAQITDDQKTDDTRVVKLEVAGAPQIHEFELPRLKKFGDGNYQVTRAKFGPLAATDVEREGVNRKDSRFSLNALVKQPLSIAQEELRVIEERVGEQVKAIEDEVKTRAMEFGFEEGKKKGYQDAFAKFERECAERIATFNQMLGELENAKSEIFRANEAFLVSLVFRISRMVMLKELSTDRDYIARLARDIIERVGLRENIKIGIHASESLTIENMKEQLEKQLGELKNLTIEVSPRVKLGGCMIETEFNAIDATIETQLQALQDSLTGAPTV